MWLLLSRVKRKVTENDIKSYLIKKPGCEDTEFVIKEIETDISQNKCFMFGAPFIMKDSVYGRGFWPKGVGVERFNFKKYYEKKNQVKDQPVDFL